MQVLHFVCRPFGKAVDRDVQDGLGDVHAKTETPGGRDVVSSDSESRCHQGLDVGSQAVGIIGRLVYLTPPYLSASTPNSVGAFCNF